MKTDTLASEKPVRILMMLENECYPDDPRVLLEARSLTAAGYQVSVICPTGSWKRWTEEIARVHVYRYPAPREVHGFWGYLYEYSYSISAMFVLAFYLFLRRGFDVVHVHTPPDMTALIAIFYKMLGKKFVFDHHDLSPELYLARGSDSKPSFTHRILLFFERLACRNADRLIATNESQRRVQTERCGVDSERCYVVRNGPNEAFLGTVVPNEAIRQAGKIVLGYVGAIGVQDGVDYMVRVVAELRQEHHRDDFTAVIVGAGPALTSLKKLAKEMCVDDLIRFTGSIPFAEVPAYIAAFDICLTPDPSNAYNDSCTTIKTMEYMTLRKPTVCFQTRENAITASDAALYADNNDVGRFAELVIELMDSPEKRQEMGRIARSRIDEGLTWNHQSIHLRALYRSLFGVNHNAAIGTASEAHNNALEDADTRPQ